MAQRLLTLINDQRLGAGLAALSPDGALMAAAQGYSQAMAEAGILAHQLPGGAPLRTRAEAAGYLGWSAMAENVAWGQTSPEEVLAMWLSSPGHRANLLNPAYTEAGVGHYFYSEKGHYWVLDLGSR